MQTSFSGITSGNSCQRCGTCCRKGGPALHLRDRHLIDSGALLIEDLVTIRRGELVQHPLAEQPQATPQEFLKIKGQRGRWSCNFFDEATCACRNYAARPLSCVLFKCWQPQAALAQIGRELLSRFDLIPATDPLLPRVRWHELVCPCPDMVETARRLAAPEARGKILRHLTELVNRDFALRERTVRRYNLSLDQELFYFGRPLLHQLRGLGIIGRESPRGVMLHYRGL